MYAKEKIKNSGSPAVLVNIRVNLPDGGSMICEVQLYAGLQILLIGSSSKRENTAVIIQEKIKHLFVMLHYMATGRLGIA